MLRTLAAAAAAALALASCGIVGGSGDGDALVVYSGRAENLVEPLLEMAEDAGITIDVRYGGSAELAAQILEEGGNRRADVFLSQDAGALGALSKEGLLGPIPATELGKVDARYRADDGTWVGLSGRARVLVYDPRVVPQSELPPTVFALTGKEWQGKVGIAPTNASFQAFVTAMRVTQGEAVTKEWLTGIKRNAKVYENNIQIRDAVDAGEIPVGLVNHYYLYEKIAEVGAANVHAKHHWFRPGDPGALVNVSGVGILKGTKKQALAERFVAYLLSEAAQKYFAERTKEYPLTEGVDAVEGLPALASIKGPEIDLSDLASLKETLDLLAEVGLT